MIELSVCSSLFPFSICKVDSRGRSLVEEKKCGHFVQEEI